MNTATSSADVYAKVEDYSGALLNMTRAVGEQRISTPCKHMSAQDKINHTVYISKCFSWETRRYEEDLLDMSANDSFPLWRVSPSKTQYLNAINKEYNRKMRTNFKPRYTYQIKEKNVHIIMCPRTFNLCYSWMSTFIISAQNILYEIQRTPRHVSSWTAASMQRCRVVSSSLAGIHNVMV
jgi:hypothetical protein